MRIGLISDTHIPQVAEGIPERVADAFRHVDRILHAGDIYVTAALDSLERIAPTLAAMGDDDVEFPDTVSDCRVKETHLLELEGQMVYLVHHQPFSLPHIAPQTCSSGRRGVPDVVVFGHAHYPMVSRFNGVLYVNPGSPTFVHYRKGLGSVGILEIGPAGADARILDLRRIGMPDYRGGTGYGPT